MTTVPLRILESTLTSSFAYTIHGTRQNFFRTNLTILATSSSHVIRNLPFSKINSYVSTTKSYSFQKQKKLTSSTTHVLNPSTSPPCHPIGKKNSGNTETNYPLRASTSSPNTSTSITTILQTHVTHPLSPLIIMIITEIITNTTLNIIIIMRLNQPLRNVPKPTTFALSTAATHGTSVSSTKTALIIVHLPVTQQLHNQQSPTKISMASK